MLCAPRRSATAVEIAETVEAVLKLFGAAPLLIRDDTAGRPPAPHEMGSQIAIPARAAKSAPETVVGICLNLRDAGVDFTVGPLPFDVSLPVIRTELKGKAPVIETESLGFSRYRRYKKSGRSKNNRKNAHHVTSVAVLGAELSADCVQLIAPEWPILVTIISGNPQMDNLNSPAAATFRAPANMKFLPHRLR